MVIVRVAVPGPLPPVSIMPPPPPPPPPHPEFRMIAEANTTTAIYNLIQFKQLTVFVGLFMLSPLVPNLFALSAFSGNTKVSGCMGIPVIRIIINNIEALVLNKKTYILLLCS
jgi:hypothetical protein